jgi:hypothetical protein
MKANPYVAFWKKVMELKHEKPHNAWTLSFDIDGVGKVVEHEMNVKGSGNSVQQELKKIVEDHWPGTEKPGIAVHHIEVREWDSKSRHFVAKTHDEDGTLPHRVNIVLKGVPKEAVTALKELGGKRPANHEILRHAP